MKKIFILLVALVTLSSCEQYFARKLGGNVTINLAPGEKLIEATWKEGNIWYLTEPMDSNYTPKVKTFKESSMYGVCEGEVTFIEHSTQE